MYLPVSPGVAMLRKIAYTCGRITDSLTMLLAARHKERCRVYC